MTSSRVMASSSSANSDLTRQSSIYSLKSFGSTSIDDLFRNIESYGDGGETSISRQGSLTLPKNIKNKTVEEVWKNVSCDGEMTLEDFLARAGAVREEDVKAPSEIFGSDPGMCDPILENPVPGGGRGGKGRKRALMEPVDRAALQRQKRMIRNRESAARSRERKQAYTVELESLVTQLEEENAQLLRHQEEQYRKRLKRLMESLIPVTEQRKPLHPLRRTRTMEW